MSIEDGRLSPGSDGSSRPRERRACHRCRSKRGLARAGWTLLGGAAPALASPRGAPTFSAGQEAVRAVLFERKLVRSPSVARQAPRLHPRAAAALHSGARVCGCGCGCVCGWWGGGGVGVCVCVGGGGPLHIDAEDTAPPSSSSGCRQKTNLVLVPPVDVIPAPAGSVAPLYVQHTCGTCATRTSPSAAHVTTVALAECGMMRAWNTCRGSGAGKGQGYAWGRHGFCRSCTTAGVVQASQPR